jgi:Maf1 regulator
LNQSFPDHDFSSVRPSDFLQCSVAAVVADVGSKLAAVDSFSGVAAATVTGAAYQTDELPAPSADQRLQSPDAPLPMGATALSDQAQGQVLKEPESPAGGPPNELNQLYQCQRQRSDLWRTIDRQINLDDCDVYSYCPSGIRNMIIPTGLPLLASSSTSVPLFGPDDDDPYDFLTSTLADGSPDRVVLWKFVYFFVSRSLKRILLFACMETAPRPTSRGLSHSAVVNDEYDAADDSDADFGKAAARSPRSGAVGALSTAEDGDVDEDEDDDEEYERLPISRNYFDEGGIISSSCYEDVPIVGATGTLVGEVSTDAFGAGGGSQSSVNTEEYMDESVLMYDLNDPEEEIVMGNDDFDLDPSAISGGLPVSSV